MDINRQIVTYKNIPNVESEIKGLTGIRMTHESIVTKNIRDITLEKNDLIFIGTICFNIIRRRMKHIIATTIAI